MTKASKKTASDHTAGAKRRPRWRSWLFRSLAVAVVLLLVARGTLGLWLPPLLTGLAEDQGYRCTYEKLDLSLSTVEWRLTHLQLEPLEGHGPQLHLEYAHGDVSIWSLLFGDIVVPRLEVDGLDLTLVRNAAGEIVLPSAPGAAAQDDSDVAKNGSSQAEAETNAEGDDGSGEDGDPPSFLSPVRLDALRLQHVQVNWRDESVDPPLTTRIDVDMRLSDLGSMDRPFRLAASLSALEWVDRLHLELSGSSTETDAQASLQLRMGGLDLRSLDALLAPLGLSQVAGPLHGDLQGEVALSNDPALPALKLTLHDLGLGNGGPRDVALTQLGVVIPAWGDDLVLQEVTVDGLSVGALREQDGALLFAGLRLRPTESAPSSEVEAAPSEPGAGGLIVEKLLLTGHSVAWRDESVQPVADVTLRLEEFTVADLGLGTAETHPARLDGRLSAPGIFETMTLDGSLEPRRAGGDLGLNVALNGLAPDALEGYLSGAAIRHHMVDGQLQLQLQGAWDFARDGTMSGEGGLTTLTFKAAGEELSLGAVALAGLTVSPDGRAIDIESIDLSGLGAHLAWDESGVLHLPGLEIGVPQSPPAAALTPSVAEPSSAGTGNDELAAADPAVPSDSPAASPAVDTRTPDAGPATQFTLQRLTVDARQLVLAPSGIEPLRFSEFGLSLDEVVAGQGLPTMEHFDVRLALPDVVGDFHLGGQLAADGQTNVIDMTLLATGLDAAKAAALMGDTGPRPSLQDGELSLALHATVNAGAGGLAAALSLDNLSLSDQGRKVLGLKRLSVDDVLVDGPDIAVGEVIIDGPYLWVARDEDGGLRLPGLYVPPATEAEGDEGDGAEPAVAAQVAVAAEAPPAPANEAPAGEPAHVLLKHFALRGGSVMFDDGALPSPVTTELRYGMDVRDLELGDQPQPAELWFKLSLPGSLDELVLEGQLIPAPENPQAELTLSGRGVTLAAVAPYLDPVARPALNDGRLDLRLNAGVSAHPEGGQGLSLALSDFAFRDGEAGAPLLGWDKLSFVAARVDGEARVFEIDELLWLGLRGEASRDDEGAVHAMGLLLPPAAEAPAPTVEPDTALLDEPQEPTEIVEVDGAAEGVVAVAEATELDEATEAAPDTEAVLPAETTAPTLVAADEDVEERPQDMAAIAAAGAVRALPTWLRFNQFELGVDRFLWRDAGKDPVALEGLSLKNAGPIVLEDDTNSAPFEVLLTGAVPPLLDEFSMVATLDPFGVEPELSVDLGFEGLHGPALGRAAPELIDGEGLTDGRFQAHMDAAWLGRRRGPLDYDVSNGVPLEFSLSKVAFRDGVDGDVLLGLDEFRAEVDQAMGASGELRLRSVEVIKPVAYIERNDRGMQVGNLLFLNPPQEETPVDGDGEDIEPVEEASDGDAGEVLAEGAESVVVEPSEPGPEMSLKNLLMSGLEVEFRDLTTDPPMVLPLTGLDVDISDLTTRALTEPLPVAANIFLRGGAPDIELIPGQAAAPIFEEISVEGRWTLFPQLVGDTRVQLHGMELTSFRGPAAVSGVVIDDGLLDATIDLDFQDNGDLSTDANFLFSDLDIDEPEDGPISSFLKLPSALGSVLFVLRDEDGVIDVPLAIDVAAEGLSMGEVTQVAVTTLGVLVTQAIAAAPFRVVGGVTDGVGSLFGFEEDEVSPGIPVDVAFASGELWLPQAEEAALQTMAERLRVEEGLMVTLLHEMGTDDQLLLGERANPPKAWMSDMAARLRVHKALLGEERALVAERLGAELTSGLALSAKASTRELNDLDERMGLAEQGLDEMLELLRPGNERLAGRRTRIMCLSIATLRLDHAAAVLRQELSPTEFERVRVLTPRWASEPERAQATMVMTPLLRKGG